MAMIRRNVRLRGSLKLLNSRRVEYVQRLSINEANFVCLRTESVEESDGGGGVCGVSGGGGGFGGVE